MEARKPVQDLVRKAQGGDRDAFERLVEEHKARLLALVRHRLGINLRGRVEAEDIAQETVLKAFQSIGRFRYQGEDSFFRWLGGIAENSLLDLADRRRHKPHLRLDRDVPAEIVSPSKALRRDERFDRLEKALEGLSPEHREVILLARVESLPVQQIAKRMNRSRNAVGQLLWRALAKLRESFGETESLHLPPRRLGKDRQDGD